MPRHAEPITRVTKFECGCLVRGAKGPPSRLRCAEHGDRVALDRWEARAEVGPAGSRRSQGKRRFATRRKASEWVATTRAAVREGSYVPESRLTLGEHLDRWLAGKRDIRPTTRQSYTDLMRPVREAVGHLPVQAVTVAHLDRLVDARLAVGLSPRSVTSMLVVLQQALDSAMRQGLTVRNVASLVQRPRVEHREQRTWTLPQARTFLSFVAEDRLAAAWWLTMRGLRRGEVLGLRWIDVDLEASTLTIRQARVLAGGRAVVGAPKSARGRRRLPLDSHLVAALRSLRARQAAERLAVGSAYDDSGLVVTNELGRPVRPEWYSDRFNRLSRESGLSTIRLHDARHTAATLMLEAGTPVHVVAAWLGHDPAVTHRTYAHAHDDALRTAGEALSRALSGG